MNLGRQCRTINLFITSIVIYLYIRVTLQGLKKEATVPPPHHIPKAETLKFSVARIMSTRILGVAQNSKKIIYHYRP